MKICPWTLLIYLTSSRMKKVWWMLREELSAKSAGDYYFCSSSVISQQYLIYCYCRIDSPVWNCANNSSSLLQDFVLNFF